jgi:tetratricopeptide (TPR) repeat protein
MLRKACVCAVFLTLTSTLLFSQAPTNQQRNRVDYGIRGRVIIPIPRESEDRIEVKLETSAYQMIQTTYTDASGNFDFRGLAPGAYYVSVNLEGFEPVRQLVEIFGNYSGTSSVTIMLNKPSVEIRERPTGLDAADPDVVDVGQMKENFPKKAVQNFEKAMEEKQKGRVENAIKLLEESILIAPNFFHAHNNLGILYQSVKRFADAEREYKRSHQLSAKSDRPLVNLGSLYIEQSKLQAADNDARGKLLDQAMDALEESVKLNPHSAVGFFLLGDANYRSDFLEEAEVAFKKAHDLDPPHMSAAQLMLANIYVKLQKWEEVMENLDQYLKENPKASDRASVEDMRARIAKTIEASK